LALSHQSGPSDLVRSCPYPLTEINKET
jgi:hypothetical protein